MEHLYWEVIWKIVDQPGRIENQRDRSKSGILVMQHLTLALAFLSEVFRSSRSHPSHFPQDQDISSPLSVEDSAPLHSLNSSSPPYPLRHLHQCSSFTLTQGRMIQRETSLSGRWNGPHVRFGHTIRVFAIFPQSATSAFSRNPRRPRFRVICISRFRRSSLHFRRRTHPSDRKKTTYAPSYGPTDRVPPRHP